MFQAQKEVHFHPQKLTSQLFFSADNKVLINFYAIFTITFCASLSPRLDLFRSHQQ